MSSSAAIRKATSMKRATCWDTNVEEAYRFQIAGYRDEIDYNAIHPRDTIDRWPHNNFIKKLRRVKDGLFYYYNKDRECKEKDLNKIKLYKY